MITHTRVRPYIHIQIHKYIYIQIHIYTNTYIHPYIHVYIYFIIVNDPLVQKWTQIWWQQQILYILVIVSLSVFCVYPRKNSLHIIKKL